jgi:hypothetical protein
VSQFRATGNQFGLATALETLASLGAERDRPERAARLYGAAATLGDATGAARETSGDDFERELAATRAALGESAFAAAWAAGAELPLDQAVAEALAEAEAPRGATPARVAG